MSHTTPSGGFLALCRLIVFFDPSPQRLQPGPQLGDLDFQGGDLLARSLGSDPPLLAALGQVGKAVLVFFDGGLEVLVLALPPISVCTGYWLLLEVFVLALPPISAHAEEAAQSAGPARVVLASSSRRRFHGGFHAYLLLLIDWWGPLSHRPSATKPITSHEAVWPCQGQPCSVPAPPSISSILPVARARRARSVPSVRAWGKSNRSTRPLAHDTGGNASGSRAPLPGCSAASGQRRGE